MKKRFVFSFFFLLIICTFLLPTLVFSQEVKNALLIANNDYPIKYLPQPVPEARNLKRALESIGFNVTLVENANRESMEDALFDFKKKCEKEGGIAFFHYGGHAVQIDGVNYLLPANTRIDNISQVRFKCGTRYGCRLQTKKIRNRCLRNPIHGNEKIMCSAIMGNV